MTNSKKPNDKQTQASATELEESELQEIEGGVNDGWKFVKYDGKDPRTKDRLDGTGSDQLKINKVEGK